MYQLIFKENNLICLSDQTSVQDSATMSRGAVDSPDVRPRPAPRLANGLVGHAVGLPSAALPGRLGAGLRGCRGRQRATSRREASTGR